MNDKAQDWIGDGIALVYLAFGLFEVFLRPLWFLFTKGWRVPPASVTPPPPSTLAPTLIHRVVTGFKTALLIAIGWLAHREWFVLFVLGNSFWFWISMSTSNRWNLLDTLLNNKLLSAQMAMLATAIGLVTLENWRRYGRVVVDFNDTTRWKCWIFSCSLCLFANVLAGVDSILQKHQGTVDGDKLTIWLLLNSFTVLFYVPILVLVARRNYDVLKSRSMAWLWVIVIILLVLMKMDAETPSITAVSPPHTTPSVP